jgi:hypothetical protein
MYTLAAGAALLDAAPVLATAPTALARRHVYLSAVLPCHAWCANKHIAVLAVHCLAAYAAASALVSGYPSFVQDGLTGAATVALATVAALAVVKPVADLPFRLAAIVDARSLIATDVMDAKKAAYQPADLGEFVRTSGPINGEAGVPIGVTTSTLDTIDAIAFDGPNGGYAVCAAPSHRRMARPVADLRKIRRGTGRRQRLLGFFLERHHLHGLGHGAPRRRAVFEDPVAPQFAP